MKITTFLLLMCGLSVCAYSESRKELWTESRNALAVCEVGIENQCYVVINEKKIDITRAEYSNIGKLGTRKSEEYEKIVTYPSKWVIAIEPEYMVHITTQAWHKGQRYTVTEPVYIKDGIYHQR